MSIEEIKIGISNKIRNRLQECNIKKKHFAQMMHVPPSQVTKWLSGKHNYTINTLFNIEWVLGISLINLTTTNEQ